jgi:hypothetical protein
MKSPPRVVGVLLVVVAIAAVLGGMLFSGLVGGPLLSPAGPFHSPSPDRSSPATASGIRTDGAGPIVTFLTGFNYTGGGWGLSFPLNFTVTSGMSHELYIWAMEGGLDPYLLPVLPAGMNVATSVDGGFLGIAVGALAPGTYSTDLYFPGWTNAVGIGVYGISNDAGFGFLYSSQAQTTSLALPAGGAAYLGVEGTGGTYPVETPSLTVINEQTPALAGGVTALVGSQSSNLFSFTTIAGGYGIAAVGIYSGLYAVNFTQSGLPAGTVWSVDLGGVNQSSTSATLSFNVPNGTYAVQASANCFQAVPSASSVTIAGAGANVSVTFSPAACSLEVTLLAGVAETPSAWYQSVPLDFTVPTGTSQVLYAWALGGGLGNYSLPALPAGLTVGAVIDGGFAGMASGALTPGTYSTDLYYSGWTNTVSVAVYGISGAAGDGLQFSARAQTTELTLGPGALAYIGIEATGGTYPVNDTSLTTVNEEAYALMGGHTELIGSQPTGAFSFTTAASGYGIVAAGLYAGLQDVNFTETGLPSGTPWTVDLNGTTVTTVASSLTLSEPNGSYSFSASSDCFSASPSSGSLTVDGSGAAASITFTPAACSLEVNLLVAFNQTFGGWGASYPVAFTVPVGTSHVIYTWALGGGLAPYLLPELPSGLTVATSLDGGFAGIAWGSLAPGPYVTDLAFPGWTNTVSIAVYAVIGDAGDTYTFASQMQSTSLSLPSGALQYLGLEATGGTYPVDNTSLTTVDASAAALLYGRTSLIGRQASDTFSFTTAAVGFGVAGLGIYSGNAVTFTETGLATGASWTVTLNGSTQSSTTSSIVFSVPNGTYAFAASAPCYSAVPSGGSVDVAGAPVNQSVTFSATGCTPVSFNETGLPFDTLWDVTVGGMTTSSNGASVGFLLPNGTFPYSVAATDGYAANVPSGTLTVVGAPFTVEVTFNTTQYPVNVTEAGLPAGGSWSVALSGSLKTTTSPTVTFYEPKGVYELLVSGPNGYRAPLTLDTRAITLNDAGVTKLVHFVRGTTAALVFHETGLRLGTTWCVSVVFRTCTTAPTIVYRDLTSGAYTYAIGSVAGYSDTARVGLLVVPVLGGTALAGRNIGFQVRFMPILYPVKFGISGLPSGAIWHVTAVCAPGVPGNPCRGASATTHGPGADLSLMLRNGTYVWRVYPIAGYTLQVNGVTGWSGTVHVNGSIAGIAMTLVRNPPRGLLPIEFASAFAAVRTS